MKLNWTHKTFSFLLSFLVLFSTLSLTIEKHFCGDTLIDVAVFTKADMCGPQSPDEDHGNRIKNSCCKNEKEVVSGIDQLVTNSIDDLDDLQQLVLFTYSYTYQQLFNELSQAVVPHRNYSPPLITQDIHVLHESYLI